jgi:NAD(P)-dependent dehydrogenase (short-subunit alcohol dehydrogenase family)
VSNLLIYSISSAVRGPDFGPEVVQKTLATNFYGTFTVLNHLFPIIRPHGRVVNMGSMRGHLNVLGENLQKQFARDDLTIDGLIDLMKKYQVCDLNVDGSIEAHLTLFML